MEQKIGEGPRHAAAALFHERAFGLTIIPRMTAAKTLELLNPKVPGLFHEQWIVGNQRPLRLGWAVAGWKCVTNCGRLMEQILEHRNRFWNKLRETEHN
jgi:hypothetical protein